LKIAALTAVTTLGIFTSQAQAHDDHSKEFARRRHVPTMFDTPIRLQYPRGLFSVGLQGAYDDETRSSGTGLRFFTPYAAGNFNYFEGHTKRTRDQTYEGRLDLGVAKEDYSINLGFSGLNDESKQRNKGSSAFTDSDGLLNTTNDTERRTDKDENYSLVGEFHRSLGKYGEIVFVGMAGKNKRKEEVDINNTTRVIGTINVPGAPNPVDIDVTVNTTANVEVRRTNEYIDFALIYRFPIKTFELGVGPYTHLSDIETKAKLFDGTTTQTILDDRVIFRSAGLDAIVGFGHPERVRVMAAARGGSLWGSSREGISDSAHRATGHVTVVASAIPFDKSTLYALSLQGTGMGGEEFYQLGLTIIKSRHSKDEKPDNDSLLDIVYGFEALKLRETALRSGFDERFDRSKKQELIFDSYQLDLHEIAGEHGLFSFNVYFDNINSDRIGALAMLTAPFLFSVTDEDGNELCPNIGVFAAGYLGSESEKDFKGFNERDYMWAAGVSWRADLEDLDLTLSARVKRTGGPSGVDTTFYFGLNLGWGYESKHDRPNYHELHVYHKPDVIQEPALEPEPVVPKKPKTKKPVKKPAKKPAKEKKKKAKPKKSVKPPTSRPTSRPTKTRNSSHRPRHT